MGNIEASILARLKNKSKEQNIPLQQLLNLFCQEEFLRLLYYWTDKDTGSVIINWTINIRS